ncbi:MAG: PAS domain S-box protein [Polyangiales bacterium]
MSTRGTVIVIHPDRAARAELGKALDRAGFTPVVLEDLGDAVAVAGRSKGAVVLASAHDKGTAVHAAVRALRAAPATHEIPILALLRSSSEPEIQEALEAGADDFLIEPLRPQELWARMRTQLRLHAYMEELAAEKQDAQVMLELTQALASSLDFREILYTVVRRIAEVVQVARVSVVLAPEPTQGDVGYVVVASDDERLTNLKLDLTKYPEIQQVLRTRKPLTISDATKHPVLDGVRSDVPTGDYAAMSLFPIVWEEQAIGVLFLRAHAERGSLSDRETHFCQIVANATAVALRNARVMQSLRDHTQQITFARFEAERRLRSLKRYADLFANVAEGIVACDDDGVILFANPRAYEIVGTSEAAVAGRKVTDIVHPVDRPKARRLWEGFAKGQYPRGVDLRVVRGSGETVVLSCSFASMIDGSSVLLISFQDVTEQRRTEAELVKTMEFLESLVEASVDGIIAADMEGNIILFNPSAERIYGYKAEDVIGKMNARRLYPGEGARDVMRRLKSPLYGGEGRLEPTRFDALDRHGHVIPIQISAAIIYENGQPAATFGIFTDLREKIRAEERLAEVQQKLAVSEKQSLIVELAGTAAHELNQPLTSILAGTELLRRRMRDPTENEQRAIELLAREAERMAEIVRKIGNITNYETKSYVGEQKILDLDRATASPARGSLEGKS